MCYDETIYRPAVCTHTVCDDDSIYYSLSISRNSGMCSAVPLYLNTEIPGLAEYCKC